MRMYILSSRPIDCCRPDSRPTVGCTLDTRFSLPANVSYERSFQISTPGRGAKMRQKMDYIVQLETGQPGSSPRTQTNLRLPSPLLRCGS